jgi:transposase
VSERRHRRRWTVEQKRRIVEETKASGASVSVVARRYDINADLLFKWKRAAEAEQLGGAGAAAEMGELVPIGVVGRGHDGGPMLLARMADGGAGLRAAELGARPGGIEIDLPCGTRVRVDAAVDARALGRALAAKERELAARDAEIHAKTLPIEKRRATLALITRARFGRSSERIEQHELLIGDLEEEAAEQQARRDAAVARRPSRSGARRPRGRQPWPAHLPRERVEPAATCVCPTWGGNPTWGARSSAGSAPTSARCWSTCPRTSRWWSTSAPR